ncbi:ABC transporter substrate-binding protein [Oceanobacillus kimchii]|uniref:ABC transporter substrate-binding protein n=1 Tax=Oceanobacillus TaxID=182709 RepID=UPI00034C059C|nr:MULTISPECIES: ABC transporter substrate-binding protein [Oceanobacillus]MCT1577925.1 ABC transporter substrate-binding protein [Oceanobacillus kimchii]MCT2137485.1 ABC transporter substrate-binding protein [Oceanobacillus kimchii]OEH55208.1 peptide ABC transporter substrate-binding protein [Oceanobacillus sp. E9]
MKKKYLILLILTLVVLIMAACSGDGGANPEDAADDSAGTEDNGSDASASEDQVLVFARGGDSESLDPGSTTDGESSRVTRQILESLLDFDKDSFEIKPGLAHDWDISEDGLTYTFYLEEGVTFHDGTDFNAEAVKTNFERWADPNHEYAFTDEGFVYNIYGTMFGGFEGDEGHVIDEINAVSDHEIEFVLKEPLGFFLQNLAMSYFAITSPAALEEYGPDITENPVGTGPFKFNSWSKNDSIVLDKFEDYRVEDQPKLDQVIFQVIPDNSARLIALQSGEIDMMDGLNPDDAAGLEGEEGIELLTRGENNFGYVGFHTQKEPVDQKEVRQAISYAIDKQAIADALYAGYATTAKNPLPPSYLGYNDGVEGYEYNPDRARELLEEAGYADGLEIELMISPTARPYMPDPETVAQIVQENLSEVGIELTITSHEWAPYLELTEQGEHQMYILGWSGTNGDPDYFLSSLLHSTNIGSSNNTFYENTEVDDLLNQAKRAVDQEERADLYMQAQELISEDAPMVTLVHSTPVMAISSNVQNYVPHPSTSESLAEVQLGE